jgi:hypothetical protein
VTSFSTDLYWMAIIQFSSLIYVLDNSQIYNIIYYNNNNNNENALTLLLWMRSIGKMTVSVFLLPQIKGN